MAKHLTILNKDPHTLNVNAPKRDFLQTIAGKGKLVAVTDVVITEPFMSLFPIRQEVIEAITESIKAKGYDDNQPIIIWKEGNVLIDGHTRLKASQLAGLEKIPAFYASFETEADVLEYMHRIQFHRRNITDADLIRLIIEALPKYEKKYGEGSKAEFLTKRFTGLSETKAKQALVVAEKANQKQIQSINDGFDTIRKIYEKIKSDKITPIQNVTCDFFDDGTRQVIRCDDNGNFYFRNHAKMKEVKAFALPKFMNSETLRKRITAVIEEEMGRHDNE